MGKPRKASSHGPKRWSENGSISRAKLRIFKQMIMFVEEEVKWNTGLASQKGSHAQSKRVKQKNLVGTRSKVGAGEGE